MKPSAGDPLPPAPSPANAARHRDDARLLARIAAGDRDAFSRLYDRHATVLHSLLVRILADRDTAADVLHTVFLEIWDKAERWEAEAETPFAWMMQLARDQAVARLRQLGRRPVFDPHEPHAPATDASPDAADRIFTRNQEALVRAALATLPLEQRQVIELAYLGGLSHPELAAALDQPPATVHARARRGLLRLRETLRGIP